MNHFHKQTALRIGAVSLVLAVIAAPLAWYAAREGAENAAVAYAIEESSRLLAQNRSLNLAQGDARAIAKTGAQILVGGLFDIVEIYDQAGTRLAEATTPAGAVIEDELPDHPPPQSGKPTYESISLKDGRWVLRVTVPLQNHGENTQGYFEGERIVPEWQKQQILSDGFATALMVVLASFICGMVVYPVVVRLSDDNERKTQEVLEAHIAMMEALGQAIAKRDSDTGAHNYRVAWMSAWLGEHAGLDQKQMQTLIAGSYLHDVGKIGIPDGILLKPGRLDAAEMDIMKQHVAMGEEILLGARWLADARTVVGGHHERWDGTGYPRRLAGTDIPIQARVFAIADVFDALCSARPYKAPLPLETALAEMAKGRGSHFDPHLFDLFLAEAATMNATIADATEDKAKELMEGMVRKHFGF